MLRTDVYEALLSADKINKVVTSTNPRRLKREKLYVIKNRSFSGTLLYTKGKFAQDEIDQKEVYYFLISSKIDENN